MVDLDHFKAINDTQGHIVGDEVLREVARRLTDSVRPYDTVSRFGGEEFLLIMPDIDASMGQARLVKVHDAVCREPFQLPGGLSNITCSFGVSILFSDQTMSVEQFLDRADRALYEAKRLGRNRIAYAAHSLVS
jgi:diguanylate cyclase (GGDEF)-like protein